MVFVASELLIARPNNEANTLTDEEQNVPSVDILQPRFGNPNE
jgi:hypothetical protein